MRCLIAVDDCFLDRPGGMGRVAWDIGQALRAAGHEVAMVSCILPTADSLTTVTATDGIQIVRYIKPSLPIWHPNRDKRSIDAAANATREKLGDRRWDVVHMHSLFTGTGVRKAIGDGPRYIYTMHSPIVLEQYINWRGQGWQGWLKMILGTRRLKVLENRLLQHCSKIHTLSEFTRSWVERFHGMGDKVTVIPHWNRPDFRRTITKAEARQRLGWPQDKKILFTIRRLTVRNGLDIAIKAISPLTTENDCEFFIAGDGELRRTLEQLIDQQGQRDRIHLLGRITDEQLRWAYQAADLFVLPTIALECFGLITVESLAFGCPVIATDAGAIPEVLRPILPNCIVPAGDIAALGNKVQEFLEGSLRIPSEEALIAFVQQNYSQTAIWPQLLTLLSGNN